MISYIVAPTVITGWVKKLNDHYDRLQIYRPTPIDQSTNTKPSIFNPQGSKLMSMTRWYGVVYYGKKLRIVTGYSYADTENSTCLPKSWGVVRDSQVQYWNMPDAVTIYAPFEA